MFKNVDLLQKGRPWSTCNVKSLCLPH
uniref:Uncharacterized protein n=1 Tax=Anguilla anguilla TaxID=7936 RepID=A0A0E9PQK4_ANGAN